MTVSFKPELGSNSWLLQWSYQLSL
jgi:hypothetical protein